jgi:hypothetical protein
VSPLDFLVFALESYSWAAHCASLALLFLRSQFLNRD